MQWAGTLDDPSAHRYCSSHLPVAPSLNALSAYCGSASVVFLVAAAHGTLYRSGMLYAMYCVIVPCTVVVLGDIMEIWVDTLPSQVNTEVYEKALLSFPRHPL